MCKAEGQLHHSLEKSLKNTSLPFCTPVQNSNCTFKSSSGRFFKLKCCAWSRGVHACKMFSCAWKTPTPLGVFLLAPFSSLLLFKSWFLFISCTESFCSFFFFFSCCWQLSQRAWTCSQLLFVLISQRVFRGLLSGAEAPLDKIRCQEHGQSVQIILPLCNTSVVQGTCFFIYFF